MTARAVGLLLGVVSAALLPAFPACSSPLVSVQDELHPAAAQFVVGASIEEWPNGYYSAVVSIRNLSRQVLAIKPAMFRLEGTPPTAFVPAGRMPLFLGKSGYQMPERIAPRDSAQGEIFFGIRGSDVPDGPVKFVVSLPDGDHSFEFKLLR